MPNRPIQGPLLARVMHHGASGCGTPYVSDGDTARVLFFMNLSGAYDGCAGLEQAMADARMFAGAQDMLAALEALVRRCAFVTSPELDVARAVIARVRGAEAPQA